MPVFPSRTNLKLDNISITAETVKKVITKLDSSKVSCSDCIPVVVLKNCEPELSYILAERESSTAKNYRPVSLFSAVSKVFEKLVIDKIVNHLEKSDLFSDFQYGFRSS